MRPAAQNIPDIAAAAIARFAARPLLYGADNKPVSPSSFQYRREAARRTGSLKNWIPQRLFGVQAEASERSALVERSIDLSNNDPHAAGVIDTIATTVVGSGLTPYLTLDSEVLNIDKETARRIQLMQKSAWQTWSFHADAGRRLNFGQIQYLAKLSQLRYGEYFVLVYMLDNPSRPYMLACQVINPQRVFTPVDKLGV